MKINRIFCMLFFSFFMRVSFFTPIFGAFLSTFHNFTTSQITVIFALFSITTFIFEIPTGIIGDRFGEKRSLIFGSSLLVLSTTIFLADSKYFMYLAEITLAISATFMSGSFESLLYKAINESSKKTDCEKFIARAYSLQWMAICLSFLGCFIFMRFMDMPNLFLLTLFFNILTLCSSLMLPNPRRGTKNDGTIILKKCFCEITKNKNLRTIFAYNLVISMIFISGYQILQPYMNHINLKQDYNGLIYFLGALLASIGSEFFGKLSVRKTPRWIFILCVSILTISLFGFYLSYKSVIVVTILMCLYRFAWGLSTPLLVFISNKQLESDEFRNTFFSMISLASNLLVGIILFIFASLPLKISENYGILCLVSLVIAVYACYPKKHNIL